MNKTLTHDWTRGVNRTAKSVLKSDAIRQGKCCQKIFKKVIDLPRSDTAGCASGSGKHKM